MKIDLRKQDLRTAPVRTIVTTSKGFDFRLIKRDSKTRKETWRDLTSNLVWYDREEWTGSHSKAIEKFGDKLPTIEEFEEAENHGFREVLPNMNFWFWSASPYPYSKYFARVFNGDSGYTDSGYRDVDYSVRCVGR